MSALKRCGKELVMSLKVSVLMVTYNHRQFIAEALESALNQKTSFEYEIVIGEDNSTDGTKEIVADYARRYPEKIRALLATRNRGMHENFFGTWKACKGQYIAVLEGDDFWTSELKLQRQVEFLDRHVEHSLCFHKVTMIHHDGSKSIFPCSAKARSTVEELLVENFIPTASVVARNGVIAEPPPWVYQLSMSDWPWWVLHGLCGTLGFMDEDMAVYRMHSGGLWSRLSRSEQIQRRIAFYRAVDKALGPRFHVTIANQLYEQFWELAGERWEAKEYTQARHHAVNCLRTLPFRYQAKRNCFLLAKVLWPAAYRAARRAWHKYPLH